jgi:hypothetical protein
LMNIITYFDYLSIFNCPAIILKVNGILVNKMIKKLVLDRSFV